ncbi:DegT/DnrJ/EryC1/StrS family aminotransferase [Chitinophagaceae bacterium MMS25-I14]
METNQWNDTWVSLTPEDIQRISQQLATQPLSIASGGVMKRFEKAFAKFAGTEHAVATNNGTAALYSALWAAGVRAGDEVLVCDYGFVAMAGAIATLKAVMVPVDMDPHSWTMDVEDLKRKITDKTKAVLVHNPWGVPAQLDAIRAATDVPVILDASHAHGALYKGRQLSAYADITCYSLGMGKLISGGELGCAVTDSADYRDKMIVLGHTNRTPFDLVMNNWNGNNVGLKFRPHVMALEIAMSQMKRFEQKKELLLDTCRKIEALFAAHGLVPQQVPEGAERVYWRITFKIDERYWNEAPAETVIAMLKDAGLPLENNPYWPLLQHQSPFQWADQQSSVQHQPCPAALSVVPQLITVPSPTTLADAQFEQIRECLVRAKDMIRETKPA